MKQIIDRKRYDTETAKEIASWDNGLGYSDFGWCKETLYKTKKGSYFIAGEGGAKTGYAQPCGNNCWGSGERIVPCTSEEALEWLENKGETDAIEKYFANDLEDA